MRRQSLSERKKKPHMNWSAAFTDLPPIALPDGRKLKTLADCRAYILALPERE
jgi:hypothetical protein